MPTIKRPETDFQRLQALEAAKAKADATAPADLAFSPDTLARLVVFLPLFRNEVQQVGSALSAQATATGTANTQKRNLFLNVSHFFQVFNLGIERNIYTKAQRAHFTLDVNQDSLPQLKTEQQISTWGQRIITGDAARVTAGGAPMANPSAADVAAAHAAYVAAQGTQSTKKDAYDNEQEEVAGMRDDADDLINDIWDEVEFTYRKETPSSKRRKAREYGIVYIPNQGEAPSPDDFSLVGKVTDAITGAPLAEAAVYIESTGAYYLSETNGNYYVPVLPAGTYNFSVLCNGYKNKDITGVVITAGVVVTLNVQLEVATTGNIQGNVAKPGAFEIANVSLDNGMPVFTDGSGNYTLADVPAGTHEVKAWYNSNPANTQTQTVDVTAGSNLTVNFSF